MRANTVQHTRTFVSPRELELLNQYCALPDSIAGAIVESALTDRDDACFVFAQQPIEIRDHLRVFVRVRWIAKSVGMDAERAPTRGFMFRSGVDDRQRVRPRFRPHSRDDDPNDPSLARSTQSGGP